MVRSVGVWRRKEAAGTGGLSKPAILENRRDVGGESPARKVTSPGRTRRRNPAAALPGSAWAPCRAPAGVARAVDAPMKTMTPFAGARWTLRTLAYAAAILLGAAALPATAEDRKLVGNFWEPNMDHIALGPAGRHHYSLAQSFTTGSSDGGYTLGSIKIIFKTASSSQPPVTLRVSVHEASGSGGPGMEVAAFDDTEVAGTGMHSLTILAPANTALKKDTEYFVVFQSQSYTAIIATMPVDRFTDTDSAYGWTMSDNYFWRVSNESDWSENVLFTPLKLQVDGTILGTDGNPPTAPGAPAELEAKGTSLSAIRLSWSPPANDGGAEITGYRIEVSPNGNDNWTDLDADTGSRDTTHDHTGLFPGTTRHYRVSAINNAVGPGTASAVANATTQAVLVPVTPVDAGSETIWEATLTVTGSNRLGNVGFSGYYGKRGNLDPDTWTYDGVSYSVDLLDVRANSFRCKPAVLLTLGDFMWRSLVNGGIDEIMKWSLHIGANKVAFLDAAFVSGKKIEWCGVTASALGWSEGVTQTVKIVRHEASAPTDLTTSAESPVRLRWTAPAKNGGSPITGYRIEYSEDGGESWDDLVADNGSTDLTYLDTDMGPGMTRSYRVSAITRFGPGVASEIKSVTIDSGSGLSGLALSDGTNPVDLDPGFAAETTVYSATVANAVSRITVTVTKSDEDATLAYLGGDDAALADADDTNGGHQLDLAVGENTIKVKVTAEDEAATTTYTLTVTRQADATLSGLALSDGTNAVPLAPGFAAATTGYTATVANAVTRVTLTATKSDEAATLAYLGGDDAPLADADDTTAGHQVDLAVGENTIQVKVTGKDGAESTTYALAVTRQADATLSGLALSDGTNTVPLAPGFAAETADYTATVANAVSRITVTATKSDETATLAYLDGNDAALADADDATGGHQVDLAVGENTVKVKVTGEDGAESTTYAVTVTREPQLTAAFVDMPLEHDGTTFTFRLQFSEDPALSYKVLRDQSFTVVGGTVRKARRVGGQEDLREIHVAPSGVGDVSVWLSGGRACGTYGAICTAGGKKLSKTLRATVLGPAALSVADAKVEEADGATLDFVVSLSRAAIGTVTVNYATEGGDAEEDIDYVAAEGTLTFVEGEQEKIVSVQVINDSHDEDPETMTLELSDATGAYIADGEATGTIENSDPLQKAWLARFGRTVASHVLDALETRLDGASQSFVRFGGYRLGGAPEVMDTVQRLAPDSSLWSQQAPADEASGHDMTARELLLRSAFHLVANDSEGAVGPRLSAWGRVSTSSFDGQEDRLSLDGTVTTATLGVDGVWKRWLTGLALAYSDADGSFSEAGTGGGDLASTLTSVHPYVAYAPTARVRLWGMLGHGSGALQLRPAEQRAMDTDLHMTMGAVGIRGALLEPPPAGGLALALRSDVLWVRTDSDAVAGAAGNLAAAQADVSRLRLVLEGSRPVALEAGGSFTPSVEVGVRRDDGDAETGSGVEVGGRLRYVSSWGLSIEAAVRGLLAHEAGDYREWGASGALRFDPGQRGLGLSASVVPVWGTAASGVSRLWGQPDAAALAADNALASAAGRLDAELGYGLAALKGRGLLTPYARVALTEGADQAWHLGARLALAESLNLSLEASRRARDGAATAHEVALLASLGW